MGAISSIINKVISGTMQTASDTKKAVSEVPRNYMERQSAYVAGLPRGMIASAFSDNPIVGSVALNWYDNVVGSDGSGVNFGGSSGSTQSDPEAKKAKTPIEKLDLIAGRQKQTNATLNKIGQAISSQTQAQKQSMKTYAEYLREAMERQNAISPNDPEFVGPPSNLSQNQNGASMSETLGNLAGGALAGAAGGRLLAGLGSLLTGTAGIAVLTAVVAAVGLYFGWKFLKSTEAPPRGVDADTHLKQDRRNRASTSYPEGGGDRGKLTRILENSNRYDINPSLFKDSLGSASFGAYQFNTGGERGKSSIERFVQFAANDDKRFESLRQAMPKNPKDNSYDNWKNFIDTWNGLKKDEKTWKYFQLINDKWAEQEYGKPAVATFESIMGMSDTVTKNPLTSEVMFSTQVNSGPSINKRSMERFRDEFGVEAIRNMDDEKRARSYFDFYTSREQMSIHHPGTVHPVIGKTKDGKPIYDRETFKEKEYSDFRQNHMDKLEQYILEEKKRASTPPTYLNLNTAPTQQAPIVVQPAPVNIPSFEVRPTKDPTLDKLSFVRIPYGGM